MAQREKEQQPVTDKEFEEMPEKSSNHFDRAQELLEAGINSDADSGE